MMFRPKLNSREQVYSGKYISRCRKFGIYNYEMPENHGEFGMSGSLRRKVSILLDFLTAWSASEVDFSRLIQAEDVDADIESLRDHDLMN